MRTHRILSLLLAAILALLPGFAQGTSEQALQEQVDALAYELLDQERLSVSVCGAVEDEAFFRGLV